MKIAKPVYRYIEFEMYHYNEYKKNIQAEREDVIVSSVCADGMPRGNKTSNPTEDKAIKLTTSTSILAMERIINAVDSALNELPKEQKKIFDEIYVKKRKDRYSMCDELGISEATYTRYKSGIVELVGRELGIIK